MSIQEFSSSLVSLLQELTMLREENAKLRKENEELKSSCSVSSRLDDISTSLEKIRQEIVTPSSSVPMQHTILECFGEMMPANDYRMIQDLLAISYKGVRNAVGGFFVTDAIIGRTIRPSHISIFTFDQETTVKTLKFYDFVRTNATNYVRGKMVCSVHTFFHDKPDFARYINFVKRMFDSAGRAIYDGEHFTHYEAEALHDYAKKSLGMSCEMSYFRTPAGALKFGTSNLTILSKQSKLEHN